MHDITSTRPLPHDLAAERRSRLERLLVNLALAVAMMISVYGVLWGDGGEAIAAAPPAQSAPPAEPGADLRALTAAIAWDTMPVHEALTLDASVGH